MSAPSDRTAGPLLLDLATVMAIITALVYFTGWTYAYHYFGHFKLGLLTLEIPTEYFFVYGFWVFKAWWWLALYRRALAARENESQGRYGEAEPLHRRALAGREKALGLEHPDTLSVQLNYTVALVNLKQPKRALQMLELMELHLLELAALQLRHTRQERVRRLFLTNQSNFQDAVLTLALSNPEPEYLDLAAKVMLRWKQIQGEEEAFLARLVRRRSEKDAEIRELAKQIADLRRDLSHLANLPEPNADLLRKKLNELEASEIRLAQISRKFNRHFQVRGASVDDVRHSLPREGGALLELRLHYPFDFKTGKWGRLRFSPARSPSSSATRSSPPSTRSAATAAAPPSCSGSPSARSTTS